MKTVSALLCLVLAVPVHGQPSTTTAAPSTAPVGALPPIIITAPMDREQRAAEIRQLEAARATGGIAAVGGLGLMGYAVFFAGAGPVGWAAGLIFFGGVGAYLAHRRLQGEEDFGPSNVEAPLQSTGPATTATPAPAAPAPPPASTPKR